jgi:hypothetical protein
MKLRLGAIAVLLVSARVAMGADDEPKRVSGRILDEAGRPAARVTVAPVWVANGLRRDQIQELQKAGQPEKLWEREGQIAAGPSVGGHGRGRLVRDRHSSP